MTTFRDAQHVYHVIGEFMKVPSRPRTFEELRQWWGNSPAYYEEGDEVAKINSIGEKIRKMNMVFEFQIREPGAIVSIDARQPGPREYYSVSMGKAKANPDLIVTTTGDVAHQFWGGQVSVPVALLTGRIRTNGSKKKALQLLPKITPAFSLYPRYLELIGEDELLKQLHVRR